ncbi:SPOR domain-containing protein [Gilliamella sp. wkB112]|uniref:SPOR domain-containing protein n=1 Tax=Gilliamella sp. wkB112 TaxID=3120257 RepID=UPI00080DA2F9|nr:SPOR domain-containing protein [Gilliamella apicola]OCG00285.1 hypothetical protein A9G12_04140 [Gilliamella apicola]
MVQRDYVRKKSRTKKNKSRFMPKLMIFIAIVLIALFSAVLYVISNNNKTDKVVEQSKKKTEPPAITLPEQPQERWTYLKELETPNASSRSSSNSVASERQQILDSFVNNPRVVTPQTQTNQTTQVAKATSISTTSQTKWLLQCGAFKDKFNADTLRAQLAMSGFSGNITSGQLYRVTVGPYTNKNDADKVVNSLKSNGINSCTVTNQ